MRGTVDELLSTDIQSSREFTGGPLCPAGDPCWEVKLQLREGFSLFASFREARVPPTGLPLPPEPPAKLDSRLTLQRDKVGIWGFGKGKTSLVVERASSVLPTIRASLHTANANACLITD